jgi:hypothetical protein
MIFPVEITLRRTLPIMTFNYAPILEIIKRDMENKNVDIIEPIENGYSFRNKFFSSRRGKNHLMSGVMYGKFELENDGNGLVLKYTYNIWVFFAIMILFLSFIFSTQSFESLFWIIFPAVFVLNWLIIFARHYFYLKNISKRITQAQTNSRI